MTKRSIRIAFLLLLLLAMGLEGIFWLRAGLREALQFAYPTTGCTVDGTPLWIDHDSAEDERGRYGIEHVLDADRNIVRTWTSREPTEARPGHEFAATVTRRPDGFAAQRFRFERPVFAWYRTWREDWPWYWPVLDDLNRSEREHRDFRYRTDSWFVWSFEDGRFVCRERRSNDVVAGFGPDGSVKGVDAAKGSRFGELQSGWMDHGSPEPRITRRQVFTAFDVEGLRLVRLSYGGTPVPETHEEEQEPTAVDVELIPIEVRTDVGFAENVKARIWRVGDELILVTDQGALLARIPVEPGETVIDHPDPMRVFYRVGSPEASHPDLTRASVETRSGPVRPDRAVRRLRVAQLDKPIAVCDLTLEPSRFSEIFLANAAAGLAALRPLPLTLFGAASSTPDSWEECALTWWGDPWLAEGRYWGWIIGSLLVAAICALLARRWARQRCGSDKAVRAWMIAVFLVGPVGLLWMRLSLPRVPVVSVGEGRRAVNLDWSPSEEEPWPEPVATGVEVFEA